MERFLYINSLYMIGLYVIGIGLSLTKRRSYIIKRTLIGSLVKVLLLNIGSSIDVAIAECEK